MVRLNNKRECSIGGRLQVLRVNRDNMELSTSVVRQVSTMNHHSEAMKSKVKSPSRKVSRLFQITDGGCVCVCAPL